MNKKITILIILIAAVIAGAVLYFVFLKKPAEPAGEGVKGIISRFFPTGEEKERAGRELPGITGEEQPAAEREEAELLQLTSEAISGAAFAGGRVRYIERAAGHLYEIGPNGEEKTRLSNTTIPGVFEVVWSNQNASSSILRYRDEGGTVRNFSAVFDKGETRGFFLPETITSIVSSPSSDEIFYLLPSGGMNVGIRADFKNQNRKELINTPFGEFKAQWYEKNAVALLSKPSGLYEGYLFRLNAAAGAFEKILGGIKGLTAKWSPDGNRVLYGQSDKNSLEIKIFDAKQKQTKNLNILTLPEKCLFSEKSDAVIYCAVPFSRGGQILPDDWYEGSLSFSDAFWKIDALNGETKIISESPESFDAVNLFLDPDEKYLFFTNKKDNTLWRLKLTPSG